MVFKLNICLLIYQAVLTSNFIKNTLLYRKTKAQEINIPQIKTPSGLVSKYLSLPVLLT